MPSAASFLEDLPKGAWIAIMVLSFILFWPAGLAVLFYLVWSGKMQTWKKEHGFGCSSSSFRRHGSTGNSAFDAYRDETLKRMEEERKAFGEFMEKLRRAKDQQEFDQFMAERRAAPSQPNA